MKNFTFLGTTQEVTECWLCGKQELKGTIVLENNETGEIVYYGSTCGSKALGFTIKEFNEKAKNADQERKNKISYYVANHPLTIKKRYELNKVYNELKLNFKQVIELGYLKKWRTWEAQTKKAAELKYGI